MSTLRIPTRRVRHNLSLLPETVLSLRLAAGAAGLTISQVVDSLAKSVKRGDAKKSQMSPAEAVT